MESDKEVSALNNVTRLYPEPKTALINWIEENFHEINTYVFVCQLNDGTTMTIHDVDSKIQALGLLEIAKVGEFKPREGE